MGDRVRRPRPFYGGLSVGGALCDRKGALPAAVLQSLHAKYAAANGEVSFEVAFASGGGKKSITVTETGAPVEGADDDEDDDKDDDEDD